MPRDREDARRRVRLAHLREQHRAARWTLWDAELRLAEARAERDAARRIAARLRAAIREQSGRGR